MANPIPRRGGPTHCFSKDVRLVIYDRHPHNIVLAVFGMGIYHLGVQVYGYEYAYFASNREVTGIYRMNPQDATELSPSGKYRMKVAKIMGQTRLNNVQVEAKVRSQFAQIAKVPHFCVSFQIDELKPDWMGNDYHMAEKNGHMFAKVLLEVLLDGPVALPDDVVGWDRWAIRAPFLLSWLPQRLMVPEAKEDSGDGGGGAKKAGGKVGPSPSGGNSSLSSSSGSPSTWTATGSSVGKGSQSGGKGTPRSGGGRGGRGKGRTGKTSLAGKEGDYLQSRGGYRLAVGRDGGSHVKGRSIGGIPVGKSNVSIVKQAVRGKVASAKVMMPKKRGI